jgi:signal transduction histidine kinase/PAS domain-containing protein
MQKNGFNILDSLTFPVALLDKDLQVVYWNSGLEELTQINHTKMLGVKIDYTFHCFKQPLVKKRIKQIFDHGEPLVIGSEKHDTLNLQTNSFYYDVEFRKAESFDNLVSFTVTRKAKPGTRADLIKHDEIHNASLFKIVRSGKLAIDIKTRRITFDIQSAEILGAKPRSINTDLGFWQERLHPSDLKSVTGYYEKLEKLKYPGSHREFQLSFRICSMTGQWLWLAVSGEMTFDENMRPHDFTATIEDITEKKQIFEIHLQRENEFHSMVENNPTAIMKLNCHKRLIFANKFAEEVLMFNPKMFLGRSFGDITATQEVADDLEEVFRRVVKTGTTLSTEIFLELTDRNYVVRFVPEYDQGGELISVITNWSDITQLSRIGKKLALLNRYNSEMIDIATSLISAPPSAVDNYLKAALKQIGLFTGFQRIYFVNFTPDLLVMNCSHEWTCSGVESTMKQFVGKMSEDYPYLLDALTKEKYIEINRIRPVFERNTAENNLFFSQNHIKSALIVPVTVYDVLYGFVVYENHEETAKMTEEMVNFFLLSSEVMAYSMSHSDFDSQLLLAKEEAEKANTTKSEFISNISHEIRTPMNGIIGYAELLKSHQQTPELENYVSSIISSSRNLLLVISNILDLALLDTDQIVQKEELVELYSFAGNINAMYAIAAKEAGNTLAVNISDDSPDYVNIDKAKLLQVIINIVDNAVKHTKDGSITVEFKTEIEHEYMKRCTFFVNVKDTGEGIPKEKIRSIFDPFKKLNTKNEYKKGGTGLGLAIAQKLIDSMNGSLSAESQEGKGSTFTLKFRNISYDYKPDKHVNSNREIIDLSDYSIAVVSEKNLAEIKEIITSTSANVISGSEIDSFFFSTTYSLPKFDLLVWDINAKDENLDAMFKKLANVRPSMKTIGISPFAEINAKVRDLFDEIIPFPIDSAALLPTIRDICAEIQPEKDQNMEIKLSDSTKEALSGKLSPLCDTVSKNMVLSEIKDFAAQLKEITVTDNVTELDEFVSRLEAAIEVFDFVAIEKMILEFKLLIGK